MIDAKRIQAGKMSPIERDSKTVAAIIRCGMKHHDFYGRLPTMFKDADAYIAMESEFPRHLCNTAKTMDIIVNSEGAAMICPEYRSDAERERVGALFALHRMAVPEAERSLYMKQPYETLKHNIGFNKQEMLASGRMLAGFLNEDPQVRKAVDGTDVSYFVAEEIVNAVNHAKMQNMARRLWMEDSDDSE